MDSSARLFLCARCGVQVLLCRRCDRGNRYCGLACRREARAEARRRAAERYQRSRGGRMAHAQRSRCFRQRQYQRRRLVAAAACASPDANNVTHHGSQPGVASAPLAVWTHTSPTVEPDDATAVAPTVTAIHTIVEATAGAALTAASPQGRVATHAWRCTNCGACQPPAVRQGFVRHGRPIRWRHDPAP
jgi:hypothetical protein